MGISLNQMVGKTWIGERWHASCVRTARYFEDEQQEALKNGDEAAAEKYRLLGIAYALETENPDTGQPKRIVSDQEATRLRAVEDEKKQAQADAEHLATLKKKLGITPRANGSAYRPYCGGLPTLGKDR